MLKIFTDKLWQRLLGVFQGVARTRQRIKVVRSVVIEPTQLPGVTPTVELMSNAIRRRSKRSIVIDRASKLIFSSKNNSPFYFNPFYRDNPNKNKDLLNGLVLMKSKINNKEDSMI